MGRITLTAHHNDNVATLLDSRSDLTETLTGLTIASDIAFGHKVAIQHIHKGEAIIKYGVAIGTATADIECGTHVHVHNCQ